MRTLACLLAGWIVLLGGCRSQEAQTLPPIYQPDSRPVFAPQEEALSQAWTYTVETTVSSGEESKRSVQLQRVRRYWVTRDRFRVEEEESGRILLGADRRFYEYNPRSKVARELDENPLMLPFLRYPALTRDWLVAEGYEVKGQETVGEQECDRYEPVAASAGERRIFWINEETSLPVAIEYGTPNGLMRYDYRDFESHDALDDGLFELPPDAQMVTDLEAA